MSLITYYDFKSIGRRKSPLTKGDEIFRVVRKKFSEL